MSVHQTAHPSEGIAVQGVGRATVVPDTLSLQLGTHVISPTVATALERASADSKNLLGILERFEVPPTHIQTGQMAIHPQWNYTGTDQRLVGYQVAIDHTVTFSTAEAAAATITAAAEQLGDSLVIGASTWSVDQPAEALATARLAAWNDANTKGRQLAELAGRALGLAVWIREAGPQPTPFATMARAEMANGPALEPGRSTIEVYLDVVFAFGAT